MSHVFQRTEPEEGNEQLSAHMVASLAAAEVVVGSFRVTFFFRVIP